jgi:glutaredoxin
VPHQVILYGKPDCHLCHEVEAMLLRLEREFPLTVEKVNILEHGDLETKYRYAIPVIVLNGQLELQAPILENELRAALQRH